MVLKSYDEKLVKAAHATFKNEDKIINLVREIQEINQGGKVGSKRMVAKEVEQDHGAVEEEKKTPEDKFRKTSYVRRSVSNSVNVEIARVYRSRPQVTLEARFSWQPSQWL